MREFKGYGTAAAARAKRQQESGLALSVANVTANARDGLVGLLPQRAQYGEPLGLNVFEPGLERAQHSLHPLWFGRGKIMGLVRVVGQVVELWRRRRRHTNPWHRQQAGHH